MKCAAHVARLFDKRQANISRIIQRAFFVYESPWRYVTMPALVSDTGLTYLLFLLFGEHHAGLVNGVMQPGRYSVTWTATEWASGVYLCRLAAGSFITTKRMMLVR